MDVIKVDFVIVGTGLAGSTAALGLSEKGDVAVLSKGDFSLSNSYAAQGGIAAAIGAADDPQLHYQDTLSAGAGLCHAGAVHGLVHRAPSLMQWLMDVGVPFDRDGTGGVSLGLEGAHSRHRILHAGGDATGRKVMETLTTKLSLHGSIVRFPGVHVTRLVKDRIGRVIGVLGVRMESAAQPTLWLAKRGVVLATGGGGQLFLHSTNPIHATGDGFALAYHAGAELRNMEFVQFHPTALALPHQSTSLLISEAVRGAGARLIDANGVPIMEDASGDLAARDVVARAIHGHLRTTGQVYLDTPSIPRFSARFPTIYEGCLKHGLDPSTTPIPVSPAAHFFMGGISSDMSGRTGLPGLYAIGEAACTGVHGANRLASNSLLECVVMASGLASSDLPSFDVSTDDIEDGFVVEPDSEETLTAVKSVMWESCGIVRREQGVSEGIVQLLELNSKAPRSPAVTTAAMIAMGALTRRESRGAHFRSDYPTTDPRWQRDSLLSNQNFSIDHLEKELYHHDYVGT